MPMIASANVSRLYAAILGVQPESLAEDTKDMSVSQTTKKIEALLAARVDAGRDIACRLGSHRRPTTT